jgi:hypothetical protein
MEDFTKVTAESIQENLIHLLLADQMLITAGTLENFDAQPTAWALIGHIWQKPVATVVLCPKGYILPYVNSNTTTEPKAVA